jgi:hypothetical protein
MHAPSDRRGPALLTALLFAGLGCQRLPGNEIGAPWPKPMPIAKQVLAAQQARATIEKVGRSELVLAREGKPLHLTLDDQTRIEQGGQPLAVAALRAGQAVRVTYDVDGRAARAQRVELVEAPAR